MSKLRESAAEYIRISTRHGYYMHRVRARILNKRGKALKKLNKGDFVKNYVPPSHEEAQSRKKKGEAYSPIQRTIENSGKTF